MELDFLDDLLNEGVVNGHVALPAPAPIYNHDIDYLDDQVPPDAQHRFYILFPFYGLDVFFLKFLLKSYAI